MCDGENSIRWMRETLIWAPYILSCITENDNYKSSTSVAIYAIYAKLLISHSEIVFLSYITHWLDIEYNC